LAKALGVPESGGIPLRQQVLAQDYVNLKKELRAVRLTQVATKVRLEAANGREEAKKLKEDLAVLAAQEKFLAEEAQQMEHQAREFERGAVNLEQLRAELTQVEEAGRRIGATVETLKGELYLFSASKRLYRYTAQVEWMKFLENY
jgi:predicted nuclease with TOPRIM domain